MEKTQFNADAVARAMLTAYDIAIVTRDFREAYETWEKQNKPKHVYPTPDLGLVLSGVVTPDKSTYQELVSAANRLENVIRHFESLPDEIRKHMHIKSFIHPELDKEAKKLEELLESGELGRSPI